VEHDPFPAPLGYPGFLRQLKERIEAARLRTLQRANSALVQLYWEVGRAILERQERDGWGSGVIRRLAADLQAAFPDSRGFSRRNLSYMRRLAASWGRDQIVQPVAARLSWRHHQVLLDRLSEPTLRQWYAEQAGRQGWSSRVLSHQIQTELHRRLGQAVTNFQTTLPPPQSDLAQGLLKDNYLFDFLGIGSLRSERELEAALTAKVRDLLLELGRGFAFVGSQVPLEVDGETFRLDLLFFHLELRGYVVIELKTGRFRPGDLGQLGFYLTAVDELLRRPEDRPTIGLLLCQEHSRVVAEYALRSHRAPMGVARHGQSPELPPGFPTAEEWQERLGEGT